MVDKKLVTKFVPKAADPLQLQFEPPTSEPPCSYLSSVPEVAAVWSAVLVSAG